MDEEREGKESWENSSVIRRSFLQNKTFNEQKDQQENLSHQVFDEKKLASVRTCFDMKDSEEKKILELIESFTKNMNLEEYEFPSSIKSKQRKKIHSAAQILGLDHFSRGYGTKRYLSLKKPHAKIPDQWQCFGFVGLMGDKVDEAAKNYDRAIPSSMIEQRIKRDGPLHHITLLKSQEVKEFLSSGVKTLKDQFPNEVCKSKNQNNPLELLMDVISEVIVDDWVDLGLGEAKNGGNKVTSYMEFLRGKVFFKVIEWPSATEFRSKMKLKPKDFHITIGFTVEDIHDVPKDRTTLLQKQTPLST